MPQKQQEHTGGRAAAVNAHVPDAGAAAGDEDLDGLVDAGSGHAQGERRKPLFPQHPEQPPKQQSQRAKFGKMGALSQQAVAAGGNRFAGGKQAVQKRFQRAADLPGDFRREQGIAPDENQIAE